MSYFLCPDNGKRYDIFGSGGARAKAAELDVPFLGEVPINIGIRERGDAGNTAGNFDDDVDGQLLPRYLLPPRHADQHVPQSRAAAADAKRAVAPRLPGPFAAETHAIVRAAKRARSNHEDTTCTKTLATAVQKAIPPDLRAVGLNEL